MIIERFQLGLIATNAYLLIDEDTKDAVVIDLGGDFSKVKEKIDAYGADLKYILNTHGHFDHILGENDAQNVVDVPVYIHEADKIMVENLPKQLERFGFVNNTLPPNNVKTFTEKDFIRLLAEQILKAVVLNS